MTAARAASVYPILAFLRRLGQKIPFKWMNVAMLGGMRGALSIALAASITASAFISQSDIETISTMVLGVAFISISVQAAFLFRYIKRNFPEEQAAAAEALNVRLSRAVSGIETLQKLKEDGKVSDEEFALQLEADKDELREILKEINSTVGTRDLLKTRASDLYGSVVTLPMSRAMQVLRSHRLSKPIESMIDRTTATSDPTKGQVSEPIHDNEDEDHEDSKESARGNA